jgi:hypothetical protein
MKIICERCFNPVDALPKIPMTCEFEELPYTAYDFHCDLHGAVMGIPDYPIKEHVTEALHTASFPSLRNVMWHCAAAGYVMWSGRIMTDRGVLLYSLCGSNWKTVAEELVS